MDALPDLERDLWIADWERNALTCPQCGNHRELCSDPNVAWFPQRTVCYATMARDSATARYDKIHKDAPYHNGTYEHWAKERGDSHPFHARDGVTIWVSEHNLTPDDDFLDEARAITPESLLAWS